MNVPTISRLDTFRDCAEVPSREPRQGKKEEKDEKRKNDVALANTSPNGIMELKRRIRAQIRESSHERRNHDYVAIKFITFRSAFKFIKLCILTCAFISSSPPFFIFSLSYLYFFFNYISFCSFSPLFLLFLSVSILLLFSLVFLFDIRASHLRSL